MKTTLYYHPFDENGECLCPKCMLRHHWFDKCHDGECRCHECKRRNHKKTILVLAVAIPVLWWIKLGYDDDQMHQEQMQKIATMNVTEFKEWQKEWKAAQDAADEAEAEEPVQYTSQYDQ